MKTVSTPSSPNCRHLAARRASFASQNPGRIRSKIHASGASLLALFAVSASVWLVGCGGGGPDSASPTAVGPAVAGSPSSSNVRLQEGDIVKVNFDVATNLATVAKLQLDGSITMPLVGEVKALGKTTQELKSDLMKLYAPLIKGEEITVNLAATTASVYVSGAVLKPGRVPMERPLTVMDAIMEAGGFDHTRAKTSRVTVFRIEDGKQHHYRVDMSKVLKGDSAAIFYVKPFDTIHVPEKTFNF